MESSGLDVRAWPVLPGIGPGPALDYGDSGWMRCRFH